MVIYWLVNGWLLVNWLGLVNGQFMVGVNSWFMLGSWLINGWLMANSDGFSGEFMG